MSEQTTTDDYNYSSAPNPQSDSLQFVEFRRLVGEQAKIELSLKTAEADVKVQKEKLASYRDGLVPKAAKALGLSDTTVDGWHVVVKDDVFGSLPDDPMERATAIKWLDDNGHGSIVQRIVTITLGRGMSDIARRIIDGINKAFPNLGLEITEKVDAHHSTLKKLARELLEAGTMDVTVLKTLGLVNVTRSKVTASK